MVQHGSNEGKEKNERVSQVRPSTAGGLMFKPVPKKDKSYYIDLHRRRTCGNNIKVSEQFTLRKREFAYQLANEVPQNSKRPFSKEDIQRAKYTFKKTQVRPSSAPQRLKHEISALLSARETSRVIPTANRSQDMFDVVKAAKEAKTFREDEEYYHTIEKSIHEPEKDETQKEAAPVFNKRLFASQGAVIITREARRLMSKNDLANQQCALDSVLTKTEVQCLRCVVDGLKLIHKGQDFVKDVLSKVVSYEIYKAFEYVQLKPWEDHLACYYIINGAVEVTYDLSAAQSRHVYQANIIYSHGTGEYLGLVSPEGPSEDLAPPATIYTKELTQFIRVDRQRFHKLMQQAVRLVDERKRVYIASHSFLAKVSDEVKEKIMHKLSIQDYPANRVLLAQGEVTEYLFIIMTGRCQTYREVYIPEADKTVLFYLTSRDPDDFFGEACVLDNAPSLCTVVSATAATLIRLHRSALKMVNRDKLACFIDELRHEIPSDQELKDRGYRNSLWNKYKHGQIKGTLQEDGKLKYLRRPHSAVVRERPPDERAIYKENMQRFVLKGSQFEPLRAHTANSTYRPRHRRRIRRPHTAIAGGLVTETFSSSEDSDSTNDHDSVDGVPARPMSDNVGQQGKRTTDEKDKTAEQGVRTSIESNVLKMLDDHAEIGAHLRQAWRTEGLQETNFMKDSVLVTMTSEDIVRKAKALADTHVDKWKHGSNENEEEWDTILHAENKQAKMLISASKLRMKDLKRRLSELQKKREKDRQRRQSGRAKYFSDDESENEDESNKENKLESEVNILPSVVESADFTSSPKKLDVQSDIPLPAVDGATDMSETVTDLLETDTKSDLFIRKDKNIHVHFEELSDLKITNLQKQ